MAAPNFLSVDVASAEPEAGAPAPDRLISG
ncbi:cupin, partial [Mesorhizobium sp. M4A.F.Ca.ET.050.02.1.1]